jgi:hypothetical protein
MRLAALFIAAMGTVHGSDATPEPEGIGYPTVAAALAELQGMPGATVYENEGWTIIGVDTPQERSIWSFTPPTHPAHPAAVKRTVYEESGMVMMKTDALCEAEKVACDALMAQFAELQRQIQQKMQGGGGGT